MGISTWPVASSGSAIKSVQRGSAAGAGNVTITSVDTTKSFVNVFGTASSGTVSASFGLSVAANANHAIVGGMSSNTAAPGGSTTNSSYASAGANIWWAYNNAAVNGANYNVNAGSNNLVSAVVQGYLSNSTTLVVSGACRWEVVEFN
mgnify:CR=1 FL=1